MKDYRILIWGTGNWCRNLLDRLPENCIIDAFVETEPLRRSFRGIPVISATDFLERYRRTDFTIVAVREHEEIKATIKSILGDLKNIFFMREYDFYTADGRGWFSLENMFKEKVVNARQAMYTSKYAVCDFPQVSFVVSSKYKMFLNGLAQECMHQEEEMKLFLQLSEKYYGVPQNVSKGYFLDIGANIGTTSLWMKKVLNPNLDIIAFEMEKENCKQFRCSCILNEVSENEIRIVEAGLSNQCGIAECMLSVREDNMGDHRVIVNGNEMDDWNREQIQLITLDDWISDNQVDAEAIKYIWMDVQAHEGFVIEGALNTLTNNRIPLVMEFWPRELRNNKSLEMLIKNVSKCYDKFVCVQEYMNGDIGEHDIQELWDLAERYAQGAVDVFLIK